MVEVNQERPNGSGGTAPNSVGEGAKARPAPSTVLTPLLDERRWLVWRWEQDKNGKPTKVPYQAADLSEKAKTNDKDTWNTYALAQAAVDRGQADGTGFVLTDSEYGAFDLDKIRDPQTGVITATWAQRLVQDCGSYTEVTPSGTGLRIIGRAAGRKPPITKIYHKAADGSPNGAVEIYRRAVRYICMTFDRLPDTLDALGNLDAAMDAILAGAKSKVNALPPLDNLPKVDVEKLDLKILGNNRARWLKEVIRDGRYLNDGKWHNFSSRSEAVWYAVNELVRASVPPEQILAILLNQSYRISDHIYDQKKSYDYARGQVENALAETSPIVKVVEGKKDEAADAAEAILIEKKILIFDRAGFLVNPDYIDSPAADGRRTKVAVLNRLDFNGLNYLVTKHVKFAKFNKTQGQFVQCDPPPEVAKAHLSRKAGKEFPKVLGVITSPTVCSDGTILVEPGYDEKTSLYVDIAPTLQMPSISDNPTEREGLAALEFLDNLLDECAFADLATEEINGDRTKSVDWSVALAMLMLPILRPTMTVAPVTLVRGHDAGTGKSFLVDIAAAIATGRYCPVLDVNRSSEEIGKRLEAALIDGRAIISLDNLNPGVIGGAALCLITERPLISLRPLGKSMLAEIESRATITMTGNNVFPSGEYVRRVPICNLDARIERPETRRFRKNPLILVSENRGKCIAMIITAVKAYLAAGAPDMKLEPLGSYHEWSRMIRSPLVWLGRADPAKSIEKSRALDPERNDIRELFEYWLTDPSLGPNNRVRSKDIEKAATFGGDFHDLLMRRGSVNGQFSTKSFGKWLTGIAGMVVGGLRLIFQYDDARGNSYILEAVTNEAKARVKEAEEELRKRAEEMARLRLRSGASEGPGF